VKFGMNSIEFVVERPNTIKGAVVLISATSVVLLLEKLRGIPLDVPAAELGVPS
jgi:hypothetical protein